MMNTIDINHDRIARQITTATAGTEVAAND
jgi:hypothetical protein